MNRLSVTLFIILSLSSFVYSQRDYSFSININGTCQPTQPGDCVPCQLYNNNELLYFQIQQGGDLYYYSYRDSLCTNLYEGGNIFEENCSSGNSLNSCEFYAQILSATKFSLTLSSSEPVAVSFIDNEPVYSQISANKLTSQGEYLGGVQVHSGSKKFRFEHQLSSTLYSCNLGVFNLGETYSHSPFTFTVSSSEVDFPLPPVTSNVTTIVIGEFITAQVVGDYTYDIFTQYHSVGIFVDENYQLDGLILTNPILTIQNMTFYPPFEQQQRGSGDLVFQLEESNSPFLIRECSFQDQSIGSTSYQLLEWGM